MRKFIPSVLALLGVGFVLGPLSTQLASASVRPSAAVSASASPSSAGGPTSIVVPSTEDVQTTVLSQSAGDSLGYGLESPSTVDVCDVCNGGESADLGTLASGTQLVFSLTDVSAGVTYLSSDPNHASVTQVAPDLWSIRWDDAGLDKDFNDLITQVHAGPVTATSQTELVPFAGLNQSPGNTTDLSVQVTSPNDTPTGSASLSVNGSVVGTQSLDDSGYTDFSVVLPKGVDAVIATYGGDATDSQSADGATINVNKFQTSIGSIKVSPKNPTTTKPVKFKVTVLSSGSKVPTGLVQFNDYTTNQLLGTATLTDGKATFSHTYSTSGSYSIVVTYPGKAGKFGPSATTTSVTVN
jgi:hypothetical protein